MSTAPSTSLPFAHSASDGRDVSTLSQTPPASTVYGTPAAPLSRAPPVPSVYGTPASTFSYTPALPLRTDGSDGTSMNTLASSDLFDAHSSSASNYTPETNLGIAANPIASTLTSLATTMESMRGQDSAAAHTTMASLSSTMTALATALTSIHEVNTPAIAAQEQSLQSQQALKFQQGPQVQQPRQPQQFQQQQPPPFQPTPQLQQPRQFQQPLQLQQLPQLQQSQQLQQLSQLQQPQRLQQQQAQPNYPSNYNTPCKRDSYPSQTSHPQSQMYGDLRPDSQDSFHSFPRPTELEATAIDDLRAEQAKLRALIEGSRIEGSLPKQLPEGLQSPRPFPNFPIPAPLPDKLPALGGPPTTVPLATQHQLFAQGMATLLDTLAALGSDVHAVRRSAIEREAAFGREVTRFFHELDSAALTSQRVEFLCAFGKRALLAQLANATAVTAAMEGVVSAHTATKEEATRLADIAAPLAQTRAALEAAASAAESREAALEAEKQRVQGEKERLVVEKDRLVAQLQAVHSAAGEHDRAVANERSERDARVSELKKELGSVADTLNAAVEVLNAIRQKGAGPESWRKAENIRTQLRWAKDTVQRYKDDKEMSLSHTMAARLALVAPQAGADTIKGRRPRAPGRLPLSTVDE
ncbi:hypothetical protein CspeluHIS016_0800270 [Cutaneotrichosporon spelunceum]|uniref:Uncharacterized protein n=1 Tax=Cutaneotrichosporon spelunceum TaxID=1672016 RepID=A0AAD3YDR7_9TREE|nr:hypothetical protein CspeluHIS016_0800270 [Cutaneotrichosporon spelunceum]